MKAGQPPPLISILIAVHDEEDYLPDAFQSVLDQDMAFRLFDVILVDDGSRDGSGALVEGYARRFANVRAFHFPEASGGAGRPWNLGLERATAPYVMILGADDAYPSGAADSLYGCISMHGNDIVSGFFRQTGSGPSLVPAIYGELLPEPVMDVDLGTCPFFLALPPAVGTRIYRRGFLDEAGIRFPEGIIAQDAVFATEALLRATSVSQLTDVVYEARIRDDPANPSVSQRLGRKYFEDFSASRHAIIDLYARHSRLDYLAARYWQDVDFVLGALIRAYGRHGAERVESLEALTWFFALHAEADTSHELPAKLAIVQLAGEREYAKALELLDLLSMIDEAVKSGQAAMRGRRDKGRDRGRLHG